MSETEYISNAVGDTTNYPAQEAEQDTSSVADEAETAGDPESPDTESDAPRKKNGFQRRIQKLVHDRETWRQRAIAAGYQPEEEDFHPNPGEDHGSAAATDEVEAIAEQRAQQIIAERSHFERIDQAKRNHPDYDQVVGSVLEEFGNVEFHPAVTDVILNLPNSGEVLYQLGGDHNLMQELLELPPHRAIALLSRISAKAEGDLNATPPISKAPPPITPVKRSAPVERGLSDELSTEEWIKRREDQLSRRRH